LEGLGVNLQKGGCLGAVEQALELQADIIDSRE
jgi:hypothetical protein